MRDNGIIARTKGENVEYMSDMALELSQLAEDSGLATLAHLFRMAALEAASATSALSDPSDVSQRIASH